MTEVEKLPCPFCPDRGLPKVERVIHVLGQKHFWVICSKCKSSSGACTSEESAVEAWNTRAPADTSAVCTDDPPVDAQCPANFRKAALVAESDRFKARAEAAEARLTDANDRRDHTEGGLQLLLAAVKAGDPQKEIIFRIKEELRQLRVDRERVG